MTAGGPTYDTPGEIVVTDNSTSQTGGNSVSFDLRIADNGPNGPVTVIKTGPGPTKFRGHNTFSGNMYILQGRIQMAGSELNAASGDVTANTANPDAFGSGAIYVLPGGQAFPSGAGGNTNAGLTAITNNWFLAGNGVSDNVGAIRLGGVFSNGLFTLIGDTRLGGGNAGTGVNIYNKITGLFNLDFGATGNSGGSGNGARLFNQSNDWTGDTRIVARLGSSSTTRLYLGTNDVIPDGFGKGNFIVGIDGVGGSSLCIFDMDGFSETVNGLFSDGAETRDFIENGAASTTSTLTVGNNDQSGTFGGIIRNNDGSGGIMALTKIGGGVQTLTRTNSFTGPTTVNGGTLSLVGEGRVSSTVIAVNSGATLDVSDLTASFIPTNTLILNGGTLSSVAVQSIVPTLTMTNAALSVLVNTAATNVVATALTTGGATNLINIVSVAGVSGYPATFPIIKYGSLGGAGNNFAIGSVPSTNTVGFISNDTANARIVLVLTDGPKFLTWTGTNVVNPTWWDEATTINWLAFKGSTNEEAVLFNTADVALFDDTGSTNLVDLREPLVPGAVTVSNSTQNYTFSGAGSLSGFGGLTKAGAGTLTLLNTGGDAYSGGVSVNGGTLVFGTDNVIAGGVSIAGSATVQVGTNGGTGTLPSGNVVNNGSLVINRGADLAIAGIISGAGSLSKNDTNILTLSGANSFTGAVSVAAGTLRTSNGSALGVTNNGTTISSGATLDVNSSTLGFEPISASGSGVGGNGAIINTGSDEINALRVVTLTGDTTFGGTGRWDIRESDTGNLDAILNGAFNITKVGANQVSLVGVQVDSSLGDIIVKQGTFSLETTTTTLGNSSSTLTVSNGATLQVFNLANEMDKQYVLNGDGVVPALHVDSGVLNRLGPSFGPMTFNGNILLNADAGTALTIQNSVAGTATNVTLIGGGTNLFNGSLSYPGTTTISNGMFIVNSTKTSGLGITVWTNGGLGGSGSINSENVTINGGQLVPGDPNNLLGSLNLNGADLTLNNNTNVFTLQPGGNSSRIAGIGNLNVSGTIRIRVATLPNVPLDAGDVFKLFEINGSSPGTNNFVVPTLTGYTFSLQTNVDGKSIDLLVETAVRNLFWNGNGALGNTWDLNPANTNWLAKQIVPSSFTNLDFVNFNNFPTQRVINVAVDVGPSAMNFSNVFGNDYTLQGNGAITGSTGIRLTQGGKLTILNNNTFTGTVVLDNGAITLGDGGTNGSIGTAGIQLTNTATSAFEPSPTPVIFNRGDSNLVISGPILGHIAVTNLGNGMVTLSGPNSFTGGLYVVAGTLRTDNATALGGVSNLTVVSSGATLDVGGPTVGNNNNDAGPRPVIVSGTGASGQGAIVNSSTNGQQDALQQVYLAGDTTFGGTGPWTTSGTSPGRWDIRGTVTSTNAFLSSSNLPVTLTKIGSNLVSFVGVHFDTNIGHINIQSGNLGFEQGTTSMGHPDSNITVNAGATLQFFQSTGTNDFTKVFVLNGDGAAPTIRNSSGSTVLRGSMSLSGPCVFDIGGVALTNLAVLSGSGSLIKTNGGTLALSGGGSYSGDTTVGGGTLVLEGGSSVSSSPVITIGSGATLDARGIGGTLTLASGQTLRGSGMVVNDLTAGNGSVVSPGASLGTLTVSNTLTLQPGSETILELNRSSATNSDRLVARNIAYGGTLTVTNVGPTLQSGDTFLLFDSTAANYSSQFNATNPLPPLPLGLYWTNVLASGSITVAGTLTQPATNANILSIGLFNGTNIVIHGTNENGGQNFHYEVLASTNIMSPLTNWQSLATNEFNVDGTFDYTNVINPAQPQRFFNVRAVP